MAWTTPPTWSSSQLVTATQMQVLSDDLSYLLNRPGGTTLRDNAASYTTTSTSFVDVDATNLKQTLSISGSVIEVGFTGSAKISANGIVAFDVDVDGTRYANAGTCGLVVAQLTGSTVAFFSNVSFCIRIPGLSAGSHTVKLKWMVNTGTGTLLAGNGVAQEDALTSFWAQEVA